MSSSAASKAAVAADAWRAIFDFIIATAPERNRVLGEEDLTPNDARALNSLAYGAGRTMGSLAGEWKCDASTATWIVDRLEAKGFVERRPHPSDRRARLVVLTRQGERARARQIEKSYAVPRDLLDLDLEDLVALRDATASLKVATEAARLRISGASAAAKAPSARRRGDASRRDRPAPDGGGSPPPRRPAAAPRSRAGS